METTYCQTFPTKCSLFQQQSQDAQTTAQQTTAIANAPLSDQNSLLTEITPQNQADPDFGRQLEISNSVRALVSAKNKQLLDDPAQVLGTQPSVVNAANTAASNAESGVNFNQMQFSGLKPLSQNPYEAMAVAQMQKGVPPNKVAPVTNANASQMVNLFNSQDPAGKVATIQGWQQQFGSNVFPLVMKQLVRSGQMSPSDTFLAGVDPNDPNLPQVINSIQTPSSTLRGQFSKEQLTAFDQATKSDTSLNNFQNTFAYKSLNTASYLQSVRQFTNNYALSLMGADPSLAPSAALTQAANFFNNKIP